MAPSELRPPPFQTALLAGAVAGTTVDLSLFPLDTLKTRLQSAEGFFASGGFRGIYRGIGSVVVGSAPGAAFFFCTYETTKGLMLSYSTSGADDYSRKKHAAITHMVAASAGEIAACAVRVPTEVIKQRAQAGQHGGRSWDALSHILRGNGDNKSVGVLKRACTIWRELYRGWGITVMREVPFTVLQFPLWEALKAWGRERKARTGKGLLGEAAGSSQKRDADGKMIEEEVSAPESALYGSLAGGFAAAATTPLDVLKTRVMLSKERESIASIVRGIWREGGVRSFFAGIGPRVMWISAGGAIFLGSYQWTVNMLDRRDNGTV